MRWYPTTHMLYWSISLFLLLPITLPAQSFEALIQDGIYELKEVQDVREALSFFERAESQARYQRKEAQLQEAQLLILKTKQFYAPYFKMLKSGSISLEEKRLLDAFNEYQIGLDLVSQNQQFESKYTLSLDNTLVVEAELNLNAINRQLQTAYKKQVRLAEEANFSNDFSNSIFHLKKAQSYVSESQEEELKMLHKKLTLAKCKQQWSVGEMLFELESYEWAIQAFQKIEKDCKDHFKVKEKIAQISEKAQHKLVSKARLLYQENKQEEAKELFNSTKEYGETNFYKEQLRIVYDDLLEKGDDLLTQKLYDQATSKFRAAQVYINSSEIEERIKLCKNSRIYNDFLIEGNDFLKQEKILLARNKFEQAAKSLKTAAVVKLIDQCNNYMKYRDKGDRYLDKNKEEKALEAYNLAASAFQTEEIQRKLASLR